MRRGRVRAAALSAAPSEEPLAGASGSDYDAEVSVLDEDAWTDILDGFADATIYQTWAYGAERFGSDRLRHVVVRQGGAPVAAAQVQLRVVPVAGAGIARVVWGPLWRPRRTGADPGALRACVDAIRAEFGAGAGLVVRVAPHAVDGVDGLSGDDLTATGVRPLGSAYRTMLLDLTPSVAELEQRLHASWRRNLRRGRRHELVLEEGTGDEGFEAMAGLFDEMVARKAFVPGVDFGELRAIQRSLPAHHKLRVFVALDGGSPVAAVASAAIGDTGLYVLGATGARGLQSRASYVLHWRALEWVRERGCRRYDLGGCHPLRAPGTYQFKAGLGGDDVCHLGEYEAPGRSLSRLVVRGGELEQRLVRRARRALGR